MHSTSPPTTASTPPASTCKWKRGRPVTARYGSLNLVNNSSAVRSQEASTAPIQSGKAASMEGRGQFRQASTIWDIGASQNRDMDTSLSGALQAMQLEDSARASDSTPTAGRETYRSTPAATGPEPDPQLHGAEKGASIHHVSDSRTAHVDNGMVEQAELGGAGVQNDAEKIPLYIDDPALHTDSTTERSSNREYMPSQDNDSDDTQQHNEQAEEEEEVEDHVVLNYQIPEDILRTAMLASRNTRASYWSAKLYRGPDGESLSTHYCHTMEVAERVAQYFLKEKVVGFDIEWRPHSSPKSIKQNASLIQLACEDRIALFHISQFSGTKPEELMPPTLKAVLESPDIYKVGVAVKGDFSRLHKYLNIRAQGVFELSRLHNLVELHATSPDKISNKLVGLATQVLQHLQLPLYKGGQLEDDPIDTANVRESDWSKPLDLQQIHYAAADAYAGFRLYHMLDWKRKQLRPTPPARGLCDFDSKPVPRPKASQKKPKAVRKLKDVVGIATKQGVTVVEQERVEEEEEEEAGYETAPEELMDSHELEDPVSASSADKEHASSFESVRTQKRVGRVSLTWLRDPGSDPGYPLLPQEPENDKVTSDSSRPFDYSSNPAEYGDNATFVSDPRLPQLTHDMTDDEFADPELEEALKVMDLDFDGKLKEDTGVAVSAATTARSGPATQASIPVASEVNSLDHMRDTEPEAPAVQDVSESVELSDFNPMKLEFQESATTSAPTFQPLTVPSDGVTHTPQYDLATTWAQNYLHSTIPLPSSTAPSRIRATVPHLRAYHLWHFQKLSLYEIARHLRDPPLLHSTVTSYILQAVSHEQLDYNKEVMRRLMIELPTGLRKGRWKWMAEKVGLLK